MQKIPLKPEPDTDAVSDAPAPTAVPEVLEILLLGGIWWFVLIQLPLLQQPATQFPLESSALLFKVQGLATAAIAIVLLAIRGFSAGRQWYRPVQAVPLLLALAALGGFTAWQSIMTAPVVDPAWLVALQAVVALGYGLLEGKLPGLRN